MRNFTSYACWARQIWRTSSHNPSSRTHTASPPCEFWGAPWDARTWRMSCGTGGRGAPPPSWSPSSASSSPWPLTWWARGGGAGDMGGNTGDRSDHRGCAPSPGHPGPQGKCWSWHWCWNSLPAPDTGNPGDDRDDDTDEGAQQGEAGKGTGDKDNDDGGSHDDTEEGDAAAMTSLAKSLESHF